MQPLLLPSMQLNREGQIEKLPLWLKTQATSSEVTRALCCAHQRQLVNLAILAQDIFRGERSNQETWSQFSSRTAVQAECGAKSVARLCLVRLPKRWSRTSHLRLRHRKRPSLLCARVSPLVKSGRHMSSYCARGVRSEERRVGKECRS